ncbi:MAG: glycerol kinase GlpK [Rhodospirillaceae bacterium]|nr:glycerol kinase GlpK [Rhodospirillaceae bacterium]
MAEPVILAIDQGTTSSRAIVFGRDGSVRGKAQRELPQIFPADGWVEHDPERIWQDTLAVMSGAIADAGIEAKSVAAIGITNQRETTIIWDRASGRPIANAIVWQDRRGAPLCEKIVAAGHADMIAERTGLIVDSYFSATKIAWLLDNVEGARDLAKQGRLAFGTVDCFLLWRLTGGKVHATDASNASRTMLYDIRKQRWDPDLLDLFGVPAALLPKVIDNAAIMGTVADGHGPARICIAGMAGDQQAALFGQACFKPGMVKSTYGTGCFALINTGSEPVASKNRLVTTIGYRLSGVTHYAVEGSIFNAGTAVQWLRDGLGLVTHASETEALARQASSARGVYLVPAFTGLGAPHWDANARGALVGITRDIGKPEIARAALEAVAYQTRDLIDAMRADGATPPAALRVDGGMVANNWFLQFLADQLGIAVEVPKVPETTALGAAFLAGLGSGIYRSLDDVAQLWKSDRRFEPQMGADERDALYAGWQRAVGRVR